MQQRRDRIFVSQIFGERRFTSRPRMLFDCQVKSNLGLALVENSKRSMFFIAPAGAQDCPALGWLGPTMDHDDIDREGSAAVDLRSARAESRHGSQDGAEPA
jgi:hypothetical protein